MGRDPKWKVVRRRPGLRPYILAKETQTGNLFWRGGSVKSFVSTYKTEAAAQAVADKLNREDSDNG
jgi:hypothetical protein